MKNIRWLHPFLLVAPLFLSGCLQFSFGGPGDQPGTFSYYSEIDFANESGFCFNTHDAACFFDVKTDFADHLTNNAWALTRGLTDGCYSQSGACQWTTATQASQIIGDTSNLVYFSSHGNVSNYNSIVCLRNCLGDAYGSDIAVGTAGITAPWSGPNWLVVDACSVVQQNAGWEGLFGGSLHGIFGFSRDTHGLDAVGRNTFANNIINFNTAIGAWESAVASDDTTQQLGMLVPDANFYDVIEKSGGDHFGYNGDTSPSFYQGQNDGSITKYPSGDNTQNVYNLVSENVDESHWLDAYGDPSGQMKKPNSNEHIFVSSNSVVTHYLASGGIIAEQPASGTAGAISQSDALTFALNWLQNNGGLPSDAILTYKGHITNPFPDAINYLCSICNIPQNALPAHNNMRQWVFVWRHANNGILSGDKIQINVDDAGSWTLYPSPCHSGMPDYCVRPPWNSSPDIRLYVRVWRSLGSVKSTIVPQDTVSPNDHSVKSQKGLCADNMADPGNTAVPCQEYVDNNTQIRYYVRSSDTQFISAH